MSFNSNLEKSIALMNEQDSLYKPTPFWAKASERILNDLVENGVESFRSLPSLLNFFVPTYGVPGNALTTEITEDVLKALEKKNATSKQKTFIERSMNGYQAALSDYRVLLASNEESTPPFLQKFSESRVGDPKEHFEFSGKFYSRSSLNYLLGLSFAKKYIDFMKIDTVLEIGGGFGSLGEILLKSDSKAKYIDIDIPPTSHVANYYLKECFGSENVTSFSDVESQEKIHIESLKTASVLCSWQLEKLVGKVDLFVNYISFQEMEEDVVENYLKHVSRLGSDWVLLRNMREGKQLNSKNSVGVNKAIKSNDYEEMLEGYELVDRNIHPFGFKTVDGFHSEILLFRRVL